MPSALNDHCAGPEREGLVVIHPSPHFLGRVQETRTEVEPTAGMGKVYTKGRQRQQARRKIGA